jgi:hypothetical protein
LPELGGLACTRPHVESLRPTQKPRREERTRAQQSAQQALPQRRRLAPVNSRVKRWRIVKDRSRLWQEGGRDLVMDLCCALPHFRGRLIPWQPMV